MSTNTQNRPLTSASVRSIMTKRDTVQTKHVGGAKKTFTVQGNGNVIDVLDKAGKVVMSSIAGQEGTVLQKKIFNLRANSALAMSNPRTRQFMIDGLAAEKAGKAEQASELFNQYLNSCQLSFGVLLPSGIVDSLTNGVDIAAKVIEVKTDNGSLLTIDPSAIFVQAPESVDNGTSFNIDDFLPAEEKELTSAQKRAGAKASK